MKNYYTILGIDDYSDSQDDILVAYKANTEKFRKHVLDKDVREQLININEAYLVLSDTDLKIKYDYALSNDSSSDSLNEALALKQIRAKEFIDGKLLIVPQKRKKRIWSAILCGFCLLSALGTVLSTCSESYIQENNSHTQSLPTFVPPSNWTKYNIDGSICISVPNTMELRSDFDAYTRFLFNNSIDLVNAEAIFQQKDLSNMSAEGYSTYARIIICHYEFNDSEVEHHYESPGLTSEDYRNLNEMVSNELYPYSYIDKPLWRWIEVNGTKIIEGKYCRTGDKGPVVCRLYLMCNYHEMAKMIVSYRQCDSDKWESDLNNIIRTFRWDNPQ